MDLEKSVLNNILRSDRVAGKTHRKLVKFLRMSPNEQLETGGIAVQVLLEQCFIRWRVHTSIVCLRPRGWVVR